MPKNKGKGGKNRRRGKNENDNEKRELTFKEDGQEYAQVVKMLGYVLKSLFSYSASDASHPSTQDGSLFFFVAAVATAFSALLRGPTSQFVQTC